MADRKVIRRALVSVYDKDRLLELFSLVDPVDPRVIKARADLANALF